MLSIMRDIHKLMRHYARYRTETVEEPDLLPRHYNFVFPICHHPGISQDELSKVLFINKSNVTRNLADLEKLGYIERRPCEEDKRILQVFPTEKMQILLPKVKEAAIRWNTYLGEDLTEEEQAEFQRILAKISEKAENYPYRE